MKNGENIVSETVEGGANEVAFNMDERTTPGESSHASHNEEGNNHEIEKLAESKGRMNDGPEDLLYALEDRPEWYSCGFLGIQHCLLAIGGVIGVPLSLAPIICMYETDVGYLGRVMVLNTLFFAAGIATFIQTTFGSRLPILQGGSFIFFPSTVAMLALPQNECPDGPVNTTFTNGSLLYNDTDGVLVGEGELWMRRMRQIQGAMAVAPVVELVLGLTGVIGLLMRFIGPLTIAPCVTVTGLSLLNAASSNASAQWGITFLGIALLTIFSQHLRNVKLPFPLYSRNKGWHMARTDFLKLFPVLVTVGISWILCLILTTAGAFSDDPTDGDYYARTDVRLNVLYSSQWIRFPYPGQWGLPVVTVAGVVGMLAAVVAGIISSIGDYHTCARICCAPPLPKHALNRGIAIEGVGCILAGVMGTGTGLSSYSENVAAIGITRVGSRKVLQVAGVIFMLLGLFGKFGALLVLIPDPIIGALFCVMFGMITAVGLSNLQYVDLNSSRNLFVLGCSMFMGLMVPNWVEMNSSLIDTGVQELNQIILVLLKTPVFVSGIIAGFLDNTIPGTAKERGLLSWNKKLLDATSPLSKEEKEEYERKMAESYNLPFSTDWRFSKYIPIFPEYGKPRKACEEKSRSNRTAHCV